MCDTFIALGDATLDGSVIFAKNSDRPAGEGQTLQTFEMGRYEAGSVLSCTYIDIPQVAKTLPVVLSKIDWMWGAEMGINEAGVVIGNEAVWTTASPGPPALLGMDLVRLGLERGATARAAVELITDLLETFGQGGACAQNDPGFTYDNSFILADFSEAFVLETAGKNWVVKKLTNGSANISNRLSIRAEHDFCSASVKEYKEASSNHPADFAALFSAASLDVEPCSREHWGAQYLAKNNGKITIDSMQNILKDHESGICMHGGFETTASMIVQLHADGIIQLWALDNPHPCEGSYRLIEAFDQSAGRGSV